MDACWQELSAKDLTWGSVLPSLRLSWVSLTDVGLVGSQECDAGKEEIHNGEGDALEKEMFALGLPLSFTTTKKTYYMKKKAKRGPRAIKDPCVDGKEELDCWYEAYDANTSCYYYYNTVQQISQWEVPEQPFVALSAQEESYREMKNAGTDHNNPIQIMKDASCCSSEESDPVDLGGKNAQDHGQRETCIGHEEPEKVVVKKDLTKGTRLDDRTAANVRSNLPRHMFKYWLQRYSLFSKFDEGIQLDTAGWFSATPECLAEHQAKRCHCSVIVDAFTGVGGNAIQFARHCDKVIAIDSCPQRLNMAKHNAEIYNLASKIDFICADFFSIGPGLQADVVFISPPWGGPCYRESQTLMIDDSSEVGKYVQKAVEVSRGVVRNSSVSNANGLVVFLPKNSNLGSVAELVSGKDGYDIEVAAVNGHVKAITAYVGNF